MPACSAVTRLQHAGCYRTSTCRASTYGWRKKHLSLSLSLSLSLVFPLPFLRLHLIFGTAEEQLRSGRQNNC